MLLDTPRRRCRVTAALLLASVSGAVLAFGLAFVVLAAAGRLAGRGKRLPAVRLPVTRVERMGRG